MRPFCLFAALLLAQVNFANAQIPQIERDALIALYVSADGANWSISTNWLGAAGTECTWYGVSCIFSGVEELRLQDNNLSGSIPPELGDLSDLYVLQLNSNNLSGSIPPELGNLSAEAMSLADNQLSGSIPPELGNMSGAGAINLSSNSLSGRIPSEFTDHALYSLPIGYNALWTTDPNLLAFLNSIEPDWDETQTIAPSDVVAVPMANAAVSVSWAPILYTSDSGGYRVSYSTTSGGPYTFYEMTGSKNDSSLIIRGLPSDTTFYIVVESQTDPHDLNQNTVISEPSVEVMVTTQQPSSIPMLGSNGVIVFVLVLSLAGLWSFRK